MCVKSDKKKKSFLLPCDEVLGNVDDLIAGLGGFESAVIKCDTGIG